MSSLTYYVSGHGFGHATRSAEVMRTLLRQCPDLRVDVRTTAPAWLFPPSASRHEVELDVGVVQPDALHTDESATLARMSDLVEHSDSLVATEARFLRAADTRLVVADIPPLACLAARSAGVRSVVIANFSWDWIYEPYVIKQPNARWLIAWLRQAYGQADLLLRLPFHGDLSAFKAMEDVPPISRPPSAPREVLRRRLDLPPERRAVLLSFGGIGLTSFPFHQLAALDQYVFLVSDVRSTESASLPPNVRCLPARQENFNDIIAACDAVVSKPGFGIVATCLAERVPLLYTDRGEFPEYPILVEAIHRFGRGCHIPRAELLAGRVGPYLDALLGDAAPLVGLQADGADVIAARLLQLMA